MTVEEIKVKFTAEVAGFKKAIDDISQKMKKVTDTMEGVQSDIERASSSSDKAVQKIGKSLEKEVQAYHKAAEAVKQHEQAVRKLGAQYTQASNKVQTLENAMNKQESKVNSMQAAYDAMAQVMKTMDIPDSIVAEMERLQNILDTNKEKALQLERAMLALSNSNYDVGEVGDSFMDMAQMQNSLNMVDRESEEAYNKLMKMKDATAGVSSEMLKMGSDSGMIKLENNIEAEANKLDRLRASYNQAGISADGLSNRQAQANARMDAAKAKFSGVSERIMALRQSMGSLSSTTKGEFLAGVTSKIRNVGSAASSMIHKFANGVAAVKRFGLNIASVGKSIISTASRMSMLGRAASSLKAKFSGLGKHISMQFRMIGSIILSMGIFSLFQGMGETIGEFAKHSSSANASISTLMSSFHYLKNSIVAAFQPILTVVTPIISSIVNRCADAVNAIGMLFAQLSGQKTYSKAVYVQEDYAASLDDSASSADNAAEANDKLKRSVMGFDEINKLDDNSSSSGGSGSSGGSCASGGGGHWEETAVPTTSTLSDLIKSGDWEGIGRLIADKLNSAMDSIDWKSIKNKCKKAAENIANFINGFVDEFDWTLLGETISEGLNTALTFLDTLLTDIDWDNIGKSIGNLLNGAVNKLDWKLLGKTLGDSIQSSVDVAYGFVTTFDWAKFGKSVADSLNSALKAIDWAKLAKTLSTGVKGALESITSFLTNVNWEQIGKDIVKFITNIDWIGLITSALKVVFAAAGAFADLVKGIIEGIIISIKNTDWSQVAKDMWNMIKVAWNGLKDVLVKIGAVLSVTAKGLWEGIKKGWEGLNSVLSIPTKLEKKGWSTLEKWAGTNKTLTVLIKLAKFGWSLIKNFLGISNPLTVHIQLAKKLWSTIKSWIGIGTLTENISLKKLNWSTIAKFVGTSVLVSIGLKKKWTNIMSALGLDKIFKLSLSLPHVGVNWGTKTFAGLSFSYPTGFYTYAQGGFPMQGQLFVANENGAEMVGSMDGKTAVANNQQITDGIKAGVYEAMVAAMNQNKGTDNTINVYVGGTAITDYVIKDVNNRITSTGRSPFRK